MASSSSRRRKEKEPIVVKPPTYDTKRFKSPFHKSRYYRLVEEKKVIPTTGFRLKDGKYPIMRRIEAERRWKLLCELLTDISAVMIREFYANAVRASKDNPLYKSYVRGVEVDFSPPAIIRVLQIRVISYGEPSFEKRLQGENDPDEILNGLCLEGKDWEKGLRGSSKPFKKNRSHTRS